MARSRKSNKKTDTRDNSVEKPEEAENIVSKDETETTENLPNDAEDGPSKAAETDGDTVAEDAKPEDAPASLAEETADQPEADAEGAEASDTAEKPSEVTPEETENSEATAEDAVETAEDTVGRDDGDENPETTDAETAEAADETSESETGETQAEPEEEKPVAAREDSPRVETRVVQGSMWPGFFGGVIAALVGFIIGRGDALDNYLPAAFQRGGVDTSVIEAEAAALQARTEAQEALTEAQEARIEAQEARLDALEAVGAATIQEMVTVLQAEIETLNEKITSLEAQPVPTVEPGASDEDIAALESALQEQLQAQQARIEELAARAEAAEADAAREAARILARAAVTRVQTAVETGESFTPALTDLEATTPVEVPDVLREAAEAGVPTLAALQASFPDAARAGLAAARSEVPEAEVQGIGGFLRRQLNVRSVTPREGDDPDAVLSRAQAAVSAGDLATALGEMEALPDAAKTAMDDWLQAASARKAAQDAANELADSLDSN